MAVAVSNGWLVILTMHQKQIELLKLLLKTTCSGQIMWQRESAEFHTANFLGLRCSLRFKYPLLAGDNGSDADAVEVVADRMALTFYSGSEGFNLVGEILSAAYPEFRKHNQQVETQLDELIGKIRKNTGAP